LSFNARIEDVVRSLKKISIAAALAGVLFVGTSSIPLAQQTDDVNELNKRVLELYRAGRYSEAIQIAQRVLAIREKALGRDHPEVAAPLNNLAQLYDKQGRYADAEPLYRRSLDIREKALGRDHPDVARSLNNLALLYQNQGRYAEAEPLYRRSLAIWERRLGRDHPEVATSLNNLAGLYRSQGRYADAEPLYRRSLESGLARAFFYAGARALLVSHWPVNSDAAVRLTTKAFAELRADPKIGRAEAMRRSMIDVITRGTDQENHPAYWAPFVVALMLLFHSYGANASTSVRVLATLPEAAGAITQHLSGDALPVGAKYRIIVSPESANSLTVDALSESGRKDRLFGADKVTANRSIVLPEDGGWYPVPTASREFRLVVTNSSEVFEHIVRTLDSSPRTGKDSLDDWLNQTKGAGQPAPSTSAIEGDLDEVYGRISIYRTTALKFALAKEPVIRGGPGAAIFRAAAPSVVLIKTDKSIGSGIVISQRGEVLTNWHVIDGAKFIAILLKPPAGQRSDPGDVYEGKLVKYDQIADLALIQFQRPPAKLVALRTGDERSIEVGSAVHAIGHPGGSNGRTPKASLAKCELITDGKELMIYSTLQR
jgi:tetratricopeptide (TPR) repeat protein